MGRFCDNRAFVRGRPLSAPKVQSDQCPNETAPPKHLRRFTEFSFARRIVTEDRYSSFNKGDIIMKALALLTAAAVTLFSVAASAQTYGGPYYGKGKAPPPPVVTKG